MRLEWSKSAALASLTASLTARLFCGLALDAPEAANAAWLAAPLGLALSLPVVWLMCRCSRAAQQMLAAPLFIAMALDAASAIEWTAYSESCLAFDHVSPLLMMLPLLLAVMRCAGLGGDALGGAARIWARLFGMLMLVVVLFQLPYYNAGWLRPWLGNGFGGILRTSVRAAGWETMLACGAATVCEEDLSTRDMLPGMLLATAVTAALVALRQMMAPFMASSDVSRSVRIDALLTNGRAPLYLQLPMIVAWFSGMLHLMCFEGIAACGLVRRLLPRTKEVICVAAGLGVVFALALTRTSRSAAALQASPYLYHMLSAAALLTWLLKGRNVKCAKPA